jgi:hypothetical protein
MTYNLVGIVLAHKHHCIRIPVSYENGLTTTHWTFSEIRVSLAPKSLTGGRAVTLFYVLENICS